jgi:hypothetical protein
MSVTKKVFGGLAGLLVLLVLGLILFSGSLFRAGLTQALVGVRETYGVDVSFKDARFSWGGGISLDGLEASDMSTKTDFASIKKLEADIGLSSLLSGPFTINRILIQDPVLTYYPGILDVFSSPEAISLEEGKQVKVAAAEPAVPSKSKSKPKETSGKGSSSSPGVVLKSGEVKNGKVRYKSEGAESKEVLSKVNASVKDLSNSTPFAFDLSAAMSGESKGTIGVKGKVDPATFNGDISVTLDGVEIPDPEAPWPKTNGSLSVVLEKKLSHILSTGKINMAAPPPSIPKELTAGTPFEINWTLDSNIEKDGAGKVDLKSCELAIQGLKGGPQRVSGNGSYDPQTAQGNFLVEGKEISVPILNPFIEPALKMSIQSGRANVTCKVARSGAQEPFSVNAAVQMGNLDFKDLSGERENLKFNEVVLNAKAAYSPEKDTLELEDLSATLDDIKLAVTGRVAGVQDAAKREVDLVVKNDNLDLGRIVPLADPKFSETGTLTGNAGVNISIKGQTASDKFPILNGTVDLKGVGFIPKDKPEMKVAAKGTVDFDADTISGQDLDLKLADVPGKVTFKVVGYNEPTKQVNVTCKGVSIEPLVNLYKPEMSGLLLGNLNGDVVTTIGKGSKPEALEITYTIDDGMMLTRHPIPASIVNLIGWDWLKNGFKLTKAQGRIIQDEKGYHLDPLLFMGERGGFAIKGWIGFDNKLTATARVNVSKDHIEEVPSAIRTAFKSPEGSSWAFLDIPMGGTVTRPLPKIDLKAAVETGISVLQNQLKGKLKGREGGNGTGTEKILKGVSEMLKGKSEGQPAEEGVEESGSGSPLDSVGDLLKGSHDDQQPQEEEKPAEEQPIEKSVGDLLHGLIKKKRN